MRVERRAPTHTAFPTSCFHSKIALQGRRKMSYSRLLLAVLVCSLAGAAAAQPPPVEAYGRLPAIGSAAISPDGKHVALSVGFEYKAAEPDRELTALRIVNLDTGT